MLDRNKFKEPSELLNKQFIHCISKQIFKVNSIAPQLGTPDDYIVICNNIKTGISSQFTFSDFIDLHNEVE